MCYELTCLMSGLEDLAAVRQLLEREYSNAAFSYVQLERKPTRTVIECEAVTRLRAALSESPRYLNPPGLPPSPNYTHLLLVNFPLLVMTSAQAAKGLDDSNAQAAFQALPGVLTKAGADIRRVVMSNLYPTSTAASELVRRTRFNFYERSHPPASTMMVYEGLPGGGSFAVDVVAIR